MSFLKKGEFSRLSEFTILNPEKFTRFFVRENHDFSLFIIYKILGFYKN